MNPTYIGILAAFCSTVASVPQLLQARVPGSTGDLNVYTLCQRMVGAAAWTMYAAMLSDYVLLTSSVIVFVLESVLALAKLRDWRLGVGVHCAPGAGYTTNPAGAGGVFGSRLTAALTVLA